jgi:hypothetical protein
VSKEKAPQVVRHPEARTTKGDFMATTKDTAPPTTRETIAQKALRLYPERIVEPLTNYLKTL